MKVSTLLLVAALVFYVGYDIVSTLAAYNYLGSFEYEKSFFLRASFDAGGELGFIAIKVIFSLIALYLAYLLVEHFEKFRGVGLGILAGAAAAGAYVGTSNFNIVYNGASFWLLGLDSGTVAALIIVACAIGGFLLTPAPRALNSGQ